MSSLFTKIVQGEIPCHKVAESDTCLAFLDIRPLAKGHTLVIPKQEVDYLFDLPEPLYNDVMTFARVVAKAIDLTMPCKRVGMAVVGLEVPHAHIHLVPINEVGDINFSKTPLSLTQDELNTIANTIGAAI